MPALIPMIGKRFGAWVVIDGPVINHIAFWHCRCDCGATGVVGGAYLRNGQSRSCGCSKTAPASNVARIAARFWSRVSKLGPVVREELGPCWEWTGGRLGKGYGSIFFMGRSTGAHRVSWFLEHGAGPTLSVLHKCDNPPCVRPDHLFEGTLADNSRDMVAKGRHRSCPRVGERHAGAVLTESKVLAARAAFLNGEKVSSIALRLNGSYAAFLAAVTRKSWRHI